MATGKRSGSSGSSGASRKSNQGRRTGSRSVKRKQPIHREVCAFICLFLALFVILGCFSVKGVLILLLCGFFKGLVGAGFYILPFVFILAFLILLLHNGRPVKLRVICTFLLPVSIGALVHLVGSNPNIAWRLAMLGDLYNGGVEGTAGGLIAGFLAMLLEAVISKVGAVIVFILLFLLEALGALNMTVASIVSAIRNRPRLTYDEPEEKPVDRAAAIVNHVANKRIERAEKKRVADYDLPVDEPPMPAPVTEPARTAEKKRVISPDQFLMEKISGKKPEEVKPEAAGQAPHSVPEPVPEGEPAMTDFRELAPDLPPGKPASPVQAQPVSATAEPLPPLKTEHPGEKLGPQEAKASLAAVTAEIAQNGAAQADEYVFPPVSLLREPRGASVDGTEEMRENTERLNTTLQSFGIEAHIVNVTRGPSVTRYELELDRGVKLSKVTGLADDIALSLGASGVRISAIPDKISVVGIEVPNRLVSTVSIRDVIDSPEFEKSRSRLSFAVGKDIGGNRIIGNIAKLPHMLIAGTTGSGKSVCMNSLIISLLFKSRPDEVRLIMVDPKMVELGVYNGIPHLLIPVVTDPKKAAGALQWAVTEMMRRYRMMADAGVRDLESYNKLAAHSEDERVSMEQVVVVIDELADLMLVAAKEVEESICRIAQMGRAAGIHLIIATQRPSADVITGLMKANIPSRIAFAVASAMESRIILDTQGAEKLVGKGDMLYAPLGQGKPKRVQGCFITDEEVQEVVEFIKENSTANYSDEVQAQIEQKMSQPDKGDQNDADAPAAAEDGDELLPAAVGVILETGQASVSMLQRRLKLGYARAARIVDEMEDRGIVGPFEGSKPRQLLITREQWDAMQGGTAEPENPPVEEEIP